MAAKATHFRMDSGPGRGPGVTPRPPCGKHLWIYVNVMPLGFQRVCRICGEREQWDT